jgi:ATP-dependent RNA helicase DeaD
MAARGIDVDNLSFVIHYQLPDQFEYYTHRSGRTARAGNTGISICFVEKKELGRLNEMERELGIAFKKIR